VDVKKQGGVLGCVRVSLAKCALLFLNKVASFLQLLIMLFSQFVCALVLHVIRDRLV